MRPLNSFLLASLSLLEVGIYNHTDKGIEVPVITPFVGSIDNYAIDVAKGENTETYATRLITEYHVGHSQFFPHHYKGNAEFPDVLGLCGNSFYIYSRINRQILTIDLTTDKTALDAVLNHLVKKGEQSYGGIVSINSVGNTMYIHCARAVILYDQLNGQVKEIASGAINILSILPLSDKSFFALSTDTAMHFSIMGKLINRYKTKIDVFEHTAYAGNTLYSGRIYDLSVSTFPVTAIGGEVNTKFIDNASKGADQQEVVSATPSYLVVYDRQHFGKILLLNRTTLKLARTIYFKPAGLNESTLLEPLDDPRGGVRIMAQNDKNLYIKHEKAWHNSVV